MNSNSENFDSNNWDVLAPPINESSGKKIGLNPEQKSLNVGDTSDNKEKIPEIKYVENFDSMNLKENLLRGIFAYGFETPSKIQQCCIPIISQKHDLIAQSQAGTGKTGAFTCGVLQIINEQENYTQAIIISPTRELSTQINAVVNDIGRYMKLKTTLCVGGISVDNNIKDVKDSHILIGTPGRIYDLIERRAFDVKKVSVLVMDEADVLLCKEFLIQSKKIITKLDLKSQICAFSATLPIETIDMMNRFMNKPVNVLVQKEKLSLDLIAQYYIDVGQDKYKIEVLDDMYKGLSIGQCIIYVNYKDKAKWLQEKLSEFGHAVEAIHGDLTPLERTNIMKLFRSGDYRVLISTDLLARGIDVQQVGYVINYDLPYDPDCYLHRIGRSGRYGKRGAAINFVTKRDMHTLKMIMSKFQVDIGHMPDPKYLNEYLSEKI